MIAMTPEAGLLIMWVTFTSMAMAAVIAVFTWAIRTRQFRNQDRARYLALTSGIDDKDTKDTTDVPS